MDVTQTQHGVTNGSIPSKTGAKEATNSDFETFLKMLTTQIQNQDPLKPIESSDFAVQLATFSGVEQQVRTNDMLESLSEKMGTSGLAQLAGWVGMEARAPVAVKFQGAPVTIIPTIDAGADQTILVVRDARGAEVQRIDIPVSDEPIQWAGVGRNGDPMVFGDYSFEIENLAEGNLLSVNPAESYARITEARNEGGAIVLVLAGGSLVPASEISALREAGTN